MKSALVGFTGFVGSNISQQHRFDDFYNSKNIDDIKDNTYDLLVFSGVPAVKWKANKEPEKDLQVIEELENILTTVKAKKFVLISTIDVYPVTEKKDEDFDCSTLENHAYGSNRLKFEQFCSAHFDNCTIVRLPALFGDGIKKNVIYDLLNDNCLDMININSSFQYYFLGNIWRDIEKAVDNDIDVLNLFTEPIETKEIVQKIFPEKLSSIGEHAAPELHYDLYTKYANLWRHEGSYAYSKEEIFKSLATFIEAYRENQ